uniref:Secreted protein n=1 Tax=Steinernema glaseri TaxID=37863 RepID=A0A1I7Y0D9_9BILA
MVLWFPLRRGSHASANDKSTLIPEPCGLHKATLLQEGAQKGCKGTVQDQNHVKFPSLQGFLEGMEASFKLDVSFRSYTNIALQPVTTSWFLHVSGACTRNSSLIDPHFKSMP